MYVTPSQALVMLEYQTLQLHRREPRAQARIEEAAALSTLAIWCSFTGSHEFLGYVRYFPENDGFTDSLFEGYKFETLSLIPDQWGEFVLPTLHSSGAGELSPLETYLLAPGPPLMRSTDPKIV